jgi:hypothetical protein
MSVETLKIRERPILFSAEMVQAILANRKTQTRRVVKGLTGEYFNWLGGVKPDDAVGVEVHSVKDCLRQTDDGQLYKYTGLLASCAEYPEEGFIEVRCPYGVVGDRLWVRETWQAWRCCDVEHNEWEVADKWELETLNTSLTIEHRATSKSMGPWRPSIFMPRWASRILLEVVKIRVERLQDITDEDVRSEGVTVQMEAIMMAATFGKSPEWMVYWNLWNSINNKYGNSWESNPWVWVVEFRRLK